MAKMEVNVYVTNNNGVDFKDAERFLHDGEIKFITQGRQNIFNIDSLIRLIQSIVLKMNHHDYLLISGNSVLAGLVMSAVHERFGKINLLIWDNRERAYVDRLVSFESD